MTTHCDDEHFDDQRPSTAARFCLFPRICALLLLALTFTTAASASDGYDVPLDKQTKSGLYLTAVDANEMMRAAPRKVLFVDVRTEQEVELVGMPASADANVPLMIYETPLAWDHGRDALKLKRNPNFLASIDFRLAAKGLTNGDTVVLICRSGDRSALAADILTDAGFVRVFSVVDGFEGDLAKIGRFEGRRIVNGWMVSRLPWTYPREMHRLNVDTPAR